MTSYFRNSIVSSIQILRSIRSSIRRCPLLYSSSEWIIHIGGYERTTLSSFRCFPHLYQAVLVIIGEYEDPVCDEIPVFVVGIRSGVHTRASSASTHGKRTIAACVLVQDISGVRGGFVFDPVYAAGGTVAN